MDAIGSIAAYTVRYPRKDSTSENLRVFDPQFTTESLSPNNVLQPFYPDLCDPELQDFRWCSPWESPHPRRLDRLRYPVFCESYSVPAFSILTMIIVSRTEGCIWYVYHPICNGCLNLCLPATVTPSENVPHALIQLPATTPPTQ